MALDSGTTYTLLPPSVHKTILKSFSRYCSASKNRCGGHRTYKENSCFDQDKNKHDTLDSYFASFPTLQVGLGESGIYIWKPADYLAQGSNPYDSAVVTYCNIILKSPDEDTATLGNTFMRHHDIYFDRPRQMLEIVEADCD